MPLLKELQDKVRAAHLLVRPAEEWNKLSENVHQAWDDGNEHHLDTARTYHLIAWASVARNILTDQFEEAAITIGRATTDWGIATLSTGKDNCQPQLAQTGTGTTTDGQLRLWSFEEVMADYNDCLEYLTSEPSPVRNER